MGESLREFLCLGFYRGLSWVEELSYGWDDACRLYDQPDSSMTRDGTDFLLRLREEFGLVPMDNISGRLAQLQTRHLPNLAVAAEGDDA